MPSNVKVRTCFIPKLDTSFVKQLWRIVSVHNTDGCRGTHVYEEYLLHCAMHPELSRTCLCYSVFRFTTFGTVSGMENFWLLLSALLHLPVDCNRVIYTIHTNTPSIPQLNHKSSYAAC